MACWPSPHLTGLGLRPPALFSCYRPNILVGRQCFWLAGHFCWSIGHIFKPTPFHLLLENIYGWHPLYAPSIHVYGGICLLFSFSWKLEDLNLYKEGAPPPSSRFRVLGLGSLYLSISIVPSFCLCVCVL